MRRMLLGFVVIPAMLMMGLAVQARAIAVPAFVPQQVNKTATADLIVTGSVVGMENQDVKASATPGGPAQMYRIAVIQISQTYKGQLAGKTVRVGFLAQQNVPVPGGPGGNPAGVAPGGPAILPVQPLPAPAVQPGVILPAQPGVQVDKPAAQPGFAQPGAIAKPIQAQPAQPQPAPQPFQPPFKKFPPFQQPYVNIQLNVGMDGLFFLKQHHEGKFYVLLPTYGSFVSSVENKAQFDTEVAQVKVTGNPIATLKSAVADERLTAATLLIKQYRQGFGQQQPINAEESKLILKTLMESDWTPGLYQGANFQKSPAQAFQLLNLTAQDGFQVPAEIQGKGVYSPEYVALAKSWLEKNWQTYQIKRYMGQNGGIGGPVFDGPVIQPFPLPPQPVPPGAVPGVGGAAPGGVGIAVPGVVQPAPVPAPNNQLPQNK